MLVTGSFVRKELRSYLTAAPILIRGIIPHTDDHSSSDEDDFVGRSQRCDYLLLKKKILVVRDLRKTLGPRSEPTSPVVTINRPVLRPVQAKSSAQVARH